MTAWVAPSSTIGIVKINRDPCQGRRFPPDAAAVSLHYALADGKTQARPHNLPFSLIALNTGELPEQVRQAFGRETLALVRDGHCNVYLLLNGAHQNGDDSCECRAALKSRLFSTLDECAAYPP